jgi:hypothetical protein
VQRQDSTPSAPKAAIVVASSRSGRSLKTYSLPGVQ